MPEQDKTEAGYAGDRKIVSHAGIPPKTLAPLHLWSAGADRAAIAIPPSREQLELEAKLDLARADWERIAREVGAEQHKADAKSMFADPESVGPPTIRLGSPGAKRMEAAEAAIGVIAGRIAVLERKRDFEMRQWREKHGA
jgi:hypothetical protein